MVAQFSAREIIQVAGARDLLDAKSTGAEAGGAISTDSRTLKKGDWYLALSGEVHDGHKFVLDAIARGALGCVVAQDDDQWLEGARSAGCVLLKVDNTLRAYQDLARSWRRKIDPVVIAITGSSGKTTTKEMVASVISGARRYHKSQANENNEFGVPKTLLSMPADCQVLVVEMAMRGLGQIADLAATALPTVGIITNAGTAHIELLGSVENIVKAKCELIEHLDPSAGLAIVGAPTQMLRSRIDEIYRGTLVCFSAKDLEEKSVLPDSTTFSVAGFDGDFEVNAHGMNHLQDAWCAMVAARRAGLTDSQIRAGLRSFQPIAGRGNRFALSNGALLIDESYNANPDSVKCAVDALLDPRAYPYKRKLVVLGEMAELGETSQALHLELGQWLAQKPLTALVTVGEKAADIAQGASQAPFAIKTCGDRKEAEDFVRKELSSDACIMVKGSHCAMLDKLVETLVSSEKTAPEVSR